MLLKKVIQDEDFHQYTGPPNFSFFENINKLESEMIKVRSKTAKSKMS
jgi:hypothetical protein